MPSSREYEAQLELEEEVRTLLMNIEGFKRQVPSALYASALETKHRLEALTSVRRDDASFHAKLDAFAKKHGFKGEVRDSLREFAFSLIEENCK